MKLHPNIKKKNIQPTVYYYHRAIYYPYVYCVSMSVGEPEEGVAEHQQQTMKDFVPKSQETC